MVDSNSAMKENKGGQEEELQNFSFEIMWSGKMSLRKRHLAEI